MVLAITVAIVLQGPLPGRLVLFRPTWLLPMLEGAVFVLITVLNPHRIDRESKVLRVLSLSGATLISLANAWSAANLVNGDLIQWHQRVTILPGRCWAPGRSSGSPT